MIPFQGILHVDDDRATRESMAVLLSAEGYKVSSAGGGTEAMHLASSGFRPPVLIVDFDIGQRLNGAEVAEQIWRLLCYVPPKIVLTGNASEPIAFDPQTVF